MTSNQHISGANRTRTGDSVDSLVDESSKLVDDARDLGRRALSTAGHAVQGLREEGAAVLETGKQRAAQYKSRLDDAVAENPIKSLLIAAGVGALLGIVLARRR